ncbi:Clavaminate synthase-like protein [Neolentinus lepideus HHB14362 ss-1]|uniref:Clavaminate synthase-like protein n=1 Tax=Neolentinus lepideus HHB14362 ss-1 TaxID=1314782 RepID=A0A165S9U4_9AGAM|nr:Clavaminate synthase-like protein [Neolentinus lepideus HHB14362 ss-1]
MTLVLSLREPLLQSPCIRHRYLFSTSTTRLLVHRPISDPTLIPKYADPSPREFRSNIVDHPSPCIVTGLSSNWPAEKKWKGIRDLLTSETADIVVPVELGPRNVGYNVQGAGARQWQRLETRFGLFVELLESLEWDGAAYVSQLNIDEIAPLKAAVRLPLPHAPDLAAPPNLWIGTADTYTPIHRDILGHNLLFQLLGTKAVRVFPPSDKQCLYVSEEPFLRNTSLIPFDHAFDETRWPRFYEGVKTWYEGTIGPGHAVFIPKGWYHSVRALEESISVNSWFL